MRILSTTLVNSSSAGVIGAAVDSVSGFVDAAMLIDTDPAGRTEHIKEFEAACSRASLRPIFCRYDWKDFGDARNRSLSFANDWHNSEGFDWALTLDADERMVLHGDLRVELACMPIRYSHACVMANHESGAYAKERLFRLPAREGWVGRTHEGYVRYGDSWPCSETLVFSELEKTPAQYWEKFARDALTLEEQTRSEERSRWFFYLGDAHQNLAALRSQGLFAQEEPKVGYHLERAIAAFVRCMQVNDWPEESAIAAFRAAQCAGERGRWSQALQLAAAGLTYDCRIPELPFISALACLKAGDFVQASNWAGIAIGVAELYPERTSCRFLPAYYEGPYDVMRAAYAGLGFDSLEKAAASRYEERKAEREASASKDAWTAGVMRPAVPRE